jgi:hypothetical protein
LPARAPRDRVHFCLRNPRFDPVQSTQKHKLIGMAM